MEKALDSRDLSGLVIAMLLYLKRFA